MSIDRKIKMKKFKIEKDLRPCNASRYPLYGNRFNPRAYNTVDRYGAFALLGVRARKPGGLL